MAKMPFSQFYPREVHSASNAIKELCSPKAETNLFLGSYLAKLAIEVIVLSKSIAKESSEDLTETARLEDQSFDSKFEDLRNLSEMKAEMSSLGAESEACATIAKSIEDHGGKIEEFSRAVQITTMDVVLEKWAEESFQEVITKAKVRPLYLDVVETHNALKSTEALRTTLSAESEDVKPMWEAKRAVTPLLSSIYNHIVDYAAIDNVEYKELLVSLKAKLAPISSQVRSRKTRNSAQ